MQYSIDKSTILLYGVEMRSIMPTRFRRGFDAASPSPPRLRPTGRRGKRSCRPRVPARPGTRATRILTTDYPDGHGFLTARASPCCLCHSRLDETKGTEAGRGRGFGYGRLQSVAPSCTKKTKKSENEGRREKIAGWRRQGLAAEMRNKITIKKRGNAGDAPGGQPRSN
jgi:hypothetical protein